VLIRERNFPSQLNCGTGVLYRLQHLTSRQLFGLNKKTPFPHVITGPFPGVSMETQLLLKISSSSSGRDSANFLLTSSSLWMGCLPIDPPDQGLSLTPPWHLHCYALKQQKAITGHKHWKPGSWRAPISQDTKTRSYFHSSPALGEAMGWRFLILASPASPWQLSFVHLTVQSLGKD